MRSPSVVGVGLAWLFLLCILDARSFDAASTSTSHSILPVATSRQTARSDWPSPLGTAAVRYTLPLDTTGDDHPLPGIGVFQATFVSGPHSVTRAGPV